MGSLVGYEFPLRYVTDEQLLFVMEEWQKLHHEQTEAGTESENPEFFTFDESTVARIVEYQDRKETVVDSVLQAFSTEALADLLTIYNIGRDNAFCEVYEPRLDRTLKQLSRDTVEHVISKTNFREDLAAGVEILGRRALSAKLRG